MTRRGRVWRCLAIGLSFVALSACKLKITVPEGGSVKTESGSYECLPLRACEIDIYDIFFDEIFIAEPDPGYKFTGWKKYNKRFQN